MSNLPYRRALVTGGTRGIGLAIARSLREAGVSVVVCGRDPGQLDRALDLVPGLQGLAVDLGRAEDRESLMEQAVDQLGGLDLLINNAGMQLAVDWSRSTAPQADARAIQREVDVNLVAPLHLTRLAVPHLAAAPGRACVVQVTSILARTPKAAAPVYCASKAALYSASISLRAQLAPLGIDVVELVPPLVDTAMTAGRSGAKCTPDVVAAALLEGLGQSSAVVPVGRASLALWMHRLLPRLLERKLLEAD